MKILISSKALAIELSSIKFEEGEEITMAELALGRNSRSRRFNLYGSKEGVVSLEVESEDGSQCLEQKDVKWDWLYDSVKKILEQPIILYIEKNSAKIILQY